MSTPKKVIGSIAAAILLAGLVGCGSGSSSPSDEQTSPDLTAEEQSAAMAMILGETNIGKAIENALGGGTAMVLRAIEDGEPLKQEAPVSVDCTFGGTITIAASGSGTSRTYTATFSNCAMVIENPIPGGTALSFSINGNIVVASTTVTYNDITVIWVCVTGSSPFHTCHMSGGSTASGSSVTYSLNGYCGSSNFSHTGTVSGAMNASNHFIVNGSATYVVSGSSGGRIVRCNYRDFDVTAATCPDYAAACGLSESYACTPNC